MNGVDPASDRNILSSERTGLSPMAWALLGIAGFLEIAFAYWMKSSEGFSRLESQQRRHSPHQTASFIWITHPSMTSHRTLAAPPAGGLPAGAAARR